MSKITAKQLNELKDELETVSEQDHHESDRWLAANRAYAQAYDAAPLWERVKHQATGR